MKRERKKDLGRQSLQVSVQISESFDWVSEAPQSKVCPLEESCVGQEQLNSSILSMLSYRAAQGAYSLFVMDTSMDLKGTAYRGCQLTILLQHVFTSREI